MVIIGDTFEDLFDINKNTIQTLHMTYIHVSVWIMDNGGNGQHYDLHQVPPHSSTSHHIWFDHPHPKPLLASPACTSSILGVIIATLLAIAKVSHDTEM